MEEDEEKKFTKVSDRHLDVADTPDIPSAVENRVDGFCDEYAQVGIDDADLPGISSVDAVLKDDHFDQVSLGDQDKPVTESQVDRSVIPGSSTLDSDHGRSSFGGAEEVPHASSESLEVHSMEPPMDDVQREETYPLKLSLSATSLDSFNHQDSGYPLIQSPMRPKPKATMPNVSPELLHLVDSAIMGKPESLEKLKNIVSGVESFGSSGEDSETTAFLVIDSLLATMGGVESFEEDEDSNPPSVMLNSRAAIVSGELIPRLPCSGDSVSFMSPRTRMVRGLLAILRSCTRNRAMCSMAGLLGVLLRSVEEIFSTDADMVWNAAVLFHSIQHLAGHSLSVEDLHRWLQVIKKSLQTVWASPLMDALEKTMNGKESRGPACSFEFVGESSGLLGPGENRWPFTNGYAFATWIYIESFADTLNASTAAAAIAAASAAKSGKTSAMSAATAGEGTAHMPRLFSFLTADNQGVEAYFYAQFLVVEIGTGKGNKASLHFTHAFKPQCWYFIGLEHTASKGELGLYIDGSLYETRLFEIPRISKPLSFCCIGSNPPSTTAGQQQRRRRHCALFAEMGPVYIFKEPIGPERMTRLASRGGDVLPCFGNGAGIPWLATNDHVRNAAEESSLFDTELGVFIHLLYHPCLLSGRYCPDASLSGAAGTLRRPAEVIGQVHVATRMKSVESFWALAYGGPMSLLPLTITNVHKDSLEPVSRNLPLSLTTYSLAAPIFRIISVAIQHPGNNEELYRTQGPEILATILSYLLHSLASLDRKHDRVGDEELVAAIVSLCHSQKINHALKVQLFRTLLLDLKLWSVCNYRLQKKLLSSLQDMVFTEATAMRNADAIQILLDGCRRCYWTIQEKDSVNSFSLDGDARQVGEVNALVDELLVIIELLMGAASPSFAAADVHRLLGFIVDSPQPNQVARVLHLMFRLVVQPNATKAQTFAEAFITSGGIETLLVLLQREAKTGEENVGESVVKGGTSVLTNHSEQSQHNQPGLLKQLDSVPQDNEGDSHAHDSSVGSLKETESVQHEKPHGSPTIVCDSDSITISNSMNADRISSVSETPFSDNKRNNNVDDSDRVVVVIIRLIGALISKGHLKFSVGTKSDVMSNLMGSGLHENGGTMFDDKVALLLFALLKAFQAAPNRLMTDNVYTTLLAASINASSTEEGLNFYDSGHRFEHPKLLLILLRSLPFASKALQNRALQDLLFLACSHPENRSSLTKMEEWPEWILEILISNYEKDAGKQSASPGSAEVEDLIHNFLIIMLEHSMRRKDGWKDIEATIHCAEWLSIVGGSSTGEKRIRREESLPIFKRRLLGGLLDFASSELQAQTQVIAAASACLAAESLAPKDAKAGVENAAQVSVFLVENTIVILMLVEDHLRQQSKQNCAANAVDVSPSPLSLVYPINNRSHTLTTVVESSEVSSSRASVSSDSGGVHLDILASMADASGQISTAVMERLAAAAAAEPYESVSCAFVSYGSCTMDLAEGWKYRSRLWYGVGLHPKTNCFGGGGTGWDSWKSSLQKDAEGNWIELPLVKKSVSMLQALLLDESGLGGGLGIGGGSGTGMGGMAALYQLLDSDQPFLCMLRMVLLSMREEDHGEESLLMKNFSSEDSISGGLQCPLGNSDSLDISSHMSPSALLWSVLSPVLNMPISDSKRQRVLVTACVLYSEVWHAVSRDRRPLRKQYLEAILPPFVAILRRWRPLLAGIHELATGDGLSPLVVDDRALAADALPIEAALSMISPEWAAAFASPPSAMALAMIAAGAAGWEAQAPPAPPAPPPLRRDSSLLERKSTKLQTFSSFQKPLEAPNDDAPGRPRDKAAAKAAALAAARDLERNAKIGSGRGLSAVAMATSAQRRTISDTERLQRWNISEAMGVAWSECLQPVDTKSVYGKDFNALSYKFIAVLVASFALARNMQRSEVDRRMQGDIIVRNRLRMGIRGWRKLVRYLVEMRCFFGPFGDHLCSPKQVFWKLDSMESSSRMRQCLRRNYSGTHNYDDQKDSKNCLENLCSPSNPPLLAAEAIAKETMYDDDDEHVDGDDLEIEGNVGEHKGENEKRISGSLEDAIQISTGINDHRPLSDQDMVQNSTEVVVNKPDERIVLEVSSSMVQPLRVVKGTFQITTRRINFIVDIRESQHLDGKSDDSKSGDQERDRSWLMSSLHQIYSRRYLLRKSALELFMVDRSNFFFDFGNTEGRRNAYRAIVQAKPPQLNNIYLSTQRPEQLLRRTQLTERWARWEISNFEYLMQLNTLAGRSYNDITQYPVFPWILCDYISEFLDLSNPSNYRDLSKPIGAINPERLKKFQEQYSSFEDPVIPKFHYGSHYSSAGAVLHYLARVEPFTTLSIQLQGGKFDRAADRMFSDVAAAWKGVLQDMSNVKELVPELFYLPEVLTNENLINFGGEKLDSVKLPAWAKNPIDFVHKQRMALESEHVSAHLHEWIDLIFGYKQRGKEAIKANNVFFYTTYEGTVDIDKITDPVKQRDTQNQITYFGQTPSQLLTVPHIKRMPLKDVLHLQTIFRNPKEIKPYPVPDPEHCNLPASAIKATSDTVVIVDMNVPAAHIAQHKWQPNTPDGQNSPFVFHHGKAASSGGTLIRMFKGDSEFPQAQAFASSGIKSSSVTAITNDGEIITGGHVDNSIKLVSSDGAKTLETAFGHCAPVTCLALSPDNNFLVTGSRDTTLLLWKFHKGNTESEQTTSSRIEGPIQVLHGHKREIISCSVSSDQGIVVSSSESSDVLLHSIHKGRVIRRLEGVKAHALCVSSDGVILIWSKSENSISTFSVNGILISKAKLPSSCIISCMELSKDGQNVVMGVNSFSDMDGSRNFEEEEEDSSKLNISSPSICFLNLYTLQVFHKLKLGEGQNITAMALNTDNTNLLVSTQDKQLIIFTSPLVVDQKLKLGSE